MEAASGWAQKHELRIVFLHIISSSLCNNFNSLVLWKILLLFHIYCKEDFNYSLGFPFPLIL